MNKETRGNMCKNKLVSKSDLPTEQSELGWSPELLSLATQPAMPPRLPISTSKCYGRVSPQPQRATPRSTAVGVPSVSRAVPGLERPSQSGKMPGAGRSGEVRCRKPSHPRLQAEVREKEGSPQRAPGLCGAWARGAGSIREVARCQGRQACSSSWKRQVGA